MPYFQTPNTYTPYGLIAFDKRGIERADDPHSSDGRMSTRLLADLTAKPPTDLFLFSHGWKGDVPAARKQYDAWIDALAGLKDDSARMGPDFRPAHIGLHWPSQPWGDEELSTDAFAADTAGPTPGDLIETYLERLELQSLSARELLGTIFREQRDNAGANALRPEIIRAYEELASLAGVRSGGLDADPGSDNASFSVQASFDAMNSGSASFGGGVLGGILGPLRQLSFLTMKKRARTVGEAGIFQFVSTLQRALPQTRVHVMGHSFGCIVASSIAGGPGGRTPLARPLDSLALVQGAVSLWSYADNIPAGGGKGYFNDVVHRPGVKGPIITTRSRHDLAVGVWYPTAVGLLGQGTDFAFDMVDLVIYGAIGAYGIQHAGEQSVAMGAQTVEYGFQPGRIYNLEASEFIRKMDGASGAHSDIAGPEVAHAIWQAALAAAQPSSVPKLSMTAVAAAGAVSAPARPASGGVTAPPMASVLPATTALNPALEMPIAFGVQAETGDFLPALQPDDLNHIHAAPAVVRARATSYGVPTFGVTAEVNPDRLAEAGWGVVFPAGQDTSAIKAALQPLLDRRRQEAGALFHLFEGDLGYQAGETAEAWLSRNGSALSVVDPRDGVPYYLLLVGSPDDIAFEFEYMLDTYFAVGRLWFEQPADYRQYAERLVAFEDTPEASRPKSIAWFTTRNPGDRATALLHDQVAVPLVNGRSGRPPLGRNQGYQITSRLAAQATKAELTNLLAGRTEAGSPALLVTGSHGVAFSPKDPQQQAKQGALLTQDWGGRGNPAGPNCYFSAADVPAGAAVQGTIHFLFACYGAGCPQYDNYTYQNGAQLQIAQRSFLSRLPLELLKSGAQAVIGHIDRAWAYSFESAQGMPQLQSFEDVLTGILLGKRVGDATDQFNMKWAVQSAALELDLLRRGSGLSDSLVANRWVARDDARNYVILGDPAARLRARAA